MHTSKEEEEEEGKEEEKGPMCKPSSNNDSVEIMISCSTLVQGKAEV